MDASRSLQLASMAAHLGLLAPQHIDTLRQEAAGGANLTQQLTEGGWLTSDDIGHLHYLLERCLPKAPAWLQATEIRTQESQSWDATPPLCTPPVATPVGSTNPDLALAAGPSNGTNERRYRVRSLHATGGIGRVWIADDASLGRQVALKDLRPEVSQPGHQLRFVEEAKITARLEHPGIVPVYELARRGDDGQPYYVMRFVRGKTLQDAIAAYHQARQRRQARPVDFLQLLLAFRAICQTLAYAHVQGVLHRDLKPANILLGDFGEVLVLDWGLAKTVSSSAGNGPTAPGDAPALSRDSETRAGQVLGTPAYMSPEQASGNIADIGPASDVWGLGAVLYDILTGLPPFRGTGVEQPFARLRR